MSQNTMSRQRRMSLHQRPKTRLNWHSWAPKRSQYLYWWNLRWGWHWPLVKRFATITQRGKDADTKDSFSICLLCIRFMVVKQGPFPKDSE